MRHKSCYTWEGWLNWMNLFSCFVFSMALHFINYTACISPWLVSKKSSISCYLFICRLRFTNSKWFLSKVKEQYSAIVFSLFICGGKQYLNGNFIGTQNNQCPHIIPCFIFQLAVISKGSGAVILRAFLGSLFCPLLCLNI